MVAYQLATGDLAWQDVLRALGGLVFIFTFLGLMLNFLIARKTKPEGKEKSGPEVERYRLPTRILHWVHAASFIVLLITGIIFFFRLIGTADGGNWLRIVHRAAGVVFVLAPLIYLPMNWVRAWEGIALAFRWGVDDLEWVKAAPQYYYLGEERAIPPQGFLNTGEKVWWLLVLVLGPVLAITGVLMWALRESVSLEALQFMLFLHDIAFIIVGTMFLVHVYMAVIHPLARPLKEGSWSAMTRGRISSAYASSHYGKWYQTVKDVKGEKEPGT